MSLNIEIDSYVMKFKFLLNDGFKAYLNVEAKDGEAYITLKVGLGCIQHLSKSTHSFSYADCVKQRSPSYYQRQDRRRQSRQNNTGGIVEEYTDWSLNKPLEL